MVDLTAERLQELLNYDPSTGIFRWRVRRGGKASVGAEAGKFTQGHRQIRIDGVLYYAHRLAWLWVTGEWPLNQIDHRNGEKADNRISKLRLATNTQNQYNVGPQRNNKSGFKGVAWHKGARKWVASIQHSGRSTHLGVFDDPVDAYEAYRRAAAATQGDFARA